MFLLWKENLHLFEEEYLQNQIEVLEHVDNDHPIRFDHMNEKIDLVNEDNVVENEILLNKINRFQCKKEFNLLDDDGEAKRLCVGGVENNTS